MLLTRLAPILDNFQMEYGREFVEGYSADGHRLVDTVEYLWRMGILCLP